STRIYCRPVCRARTPRRDRCRFYTSAAAAERAGFRPCLRCRPELAPGFSPTDAADRTARAAVARITEGALNENGVDVLARELGVGARQLRRLVEREIGVSPVELAQTCRLLLAKRLLSDTALPVTHVAYASGFRSLRRFNAMFQSRYRLSPTVLRRSAAGTPLEVVAGESRETITLTLAYRPPFAWEALLAFLGPRATPGVEHVGGGTYARTIGIEGRAGWVALSPDRASRSRNGAGGGSIRADLSISLLPVLMPLIARLRALLDLDASPLDIDRHLMGVGLAESVRRLPGLRVPGAVDGFELAVRAILGQQVTVRGATTLAGRLAKMVGEPIETGHSALTHLPVSAARVAECSAATLASIGMPRARAESLRHVARAVAHGTLRLEPGGDAASVARQMVELPGIGDWTAQYVGMRALRWPDAFPASDMGLRKAAGGATPARLRRMAERWSPWRAYAAMHLWMGGTILDDEGDESTSRSERRSLGG
ncbi:MAG TPA: AlkA N-terminal domain-containing protein, partial [Gemmatimonadaceae bacterium]|nr:AlkA N-terminal domain-containing protein [Gemmatimonadaceae bacterium]